MSGLHVDAAAMNMNGRETVAAAEDFGRELASLRNNVEGLMSVWSGLSASEFNKNYERQAQNLQGVQQLLTELGMAISKSASILSQTEEDNATTGRNLFC